MDFSNEDIIRLIVHQSKVCKSIKKVNQYNSNNQEILNDLLTIILEELKERGYED